MDIASGNFISVYHCDSSFGSRWSFAVMASLSMTVSDLSALCHPYLLVTFELQGWLDVQI